MTRERTVTMVFGTRPEAIKMLPVLRALRARPGIRTRVVVTAQHRELLDQVLGPFEVRIDEDLDLMWPGEALAPLFGRLLTGVSDALARHRPDLVLVHGDTSTTFAAALAGFYARVPVAHVEAGLRTGNLDAPWPEEANRRLTAAIGALHFAPTQAARANLLREGVDDAAIHVTGNTVVDALAIARERVRDDPAIAARFDFLDPGKRLVLVTGHRRENLGPGLVQLCAALRTLAARGDVDIVYALHLNPAARDPVLSLLQDVPGVHLLPPQDYLPFVWLMAKAHFIVTDSGGIQEEAPSLATPVLVTRALTERPEAVAAGTSTLVGTDPARIVSEATRLLDDPEAHAAMAGSENPFGDGRAAERIADAVVAWMAQRPGE